MFNGRLMAGAIALALCGAYAQAAPASAGWSDSNMSYASNYIERVATQLQSDRNDYSGHRVAAIADINQARNDIAAALAYDNGHPGAHPMILQASDVAEQAFIRTQEASNHDLRYDRAYLERAIYMLQRNNTDYGGYRVKAIGAIQAARDQIVAGLTSYHNEAGNRSDDNVRYTRGYIARGITMLSNDKHDYNGHRIAAISDMQAADADLLAALRSDRADESIPTIATLAVPSDWVRGQGASNNNIRYVRTYVEKAIDMLQNDQHDYNGYRVKAIAELQAGHQQLLAALQYR